MIELRKRWSQVAVEAEHHIIVWVKDRFPGPADGLPHQTIGLCETSVASIDPASRDCKHGRRGLERQRGGVEFQQAPVSSNLQVMIRNEEIPAPVESHGARMAE